MIEAAERLNGSAELAFVGDGPMKEIVVALAREKGLHNVRFHPQVPLDAIPPMLAGSDALLVSLSGHPTFEQFVPSKMIDFMATGRPVILSAAGESARIMERAGAGVIVPPGIPGRARGGDPLAVRASRRGAHDGRAWPYLRRRAATVGAGGAARAGAPACGAAVRAHCEVKSLALLR